MTGTNLAKAIADGLRTHQWYDNPAFPNLHEPSAHGTHEDGYTSDCAICRREINRIAAVAAQVAAKHYTPEDSIERASRWIDASGIPVFPSEQVRAWLDRLGVPVPLGIHALMAEIHRAVVAAGDTGYAAGRRHDWYPDHDGLCVTCHLPDGRCPVSPRAPQDDLAPLLAAIDNALRNGSYMTGANLAFALLCDRLGVDRDRLEFRPDWRRDAEREG